MTGGLPSFRAAFERERPEWVLFLDAARPDVFEAVYEEYLSGDYMRISNGGVQHTPGWFNENFPDAYDAMLFHGGQAIRSINTDDDVGEFYDELDHFKRVPYYTLYESDHRGLISPRAVNEVVRAHMPDEWETRRRLHALGYSPTGVSNDHDFHVVRYLQPHVPYRNPPGDPEDSPWNADPADLRSSYEDNLRWALEGVADLAPDLPGRVVVTADHGECLLDCGQAGHGELLDPHSHLVESPWLRVGE